MALEKTKWLTWWKNTLCYLSHFRSIIGFFFLFIPSAIALFSSMNDSPSTHYCTPLSVEARSISVLFFCFFGSIAYFGASLGSDSFIRLLLNGKRLKSDCLWLNKIPERYSLIVLMASSLLNCILFGAEISGARDCHIRQYRRILIPSSIGMFALSLTHLVLSIAFSCIFFLPRRYFGHRNTLTTHEAIDEDYVDACDTQDSNGGDEDEPVGVESDWSRFQQTMVLDRSILPTYGELVDTTLEEIREVLLSKNQSHPPLHGSRPVAVSFTFSRFFRTL